MNEIEMTEFETALYNGLLVQFQDVECDDEIRDATKEEALRVLKVLKTNIERFGL